MKNSNELIIIIIIIIMSEIILRENWDTLKKHKKHERKIKTRMGISTRNSDRKPTKTTESDKTKEKRRNK